MDYNSSTAVWESKATTPPDKNASSLTEVNQCLLWGPYDFRTRTGPLLDTLGQRTRCRTVAASMAPAIAQRVAGAVEGPATQAPCHDDEDKWLPHAPFTQPLIIDDVPARLPHNRPCLQHHRGGCVGEACKRDVFSGHPLLTCFLFIHSSSCLSVVDVRLHRDGRLLLPPSPSQNHLCSTPQDIHDVAHKGRHPEPERDR